MRFFFFWVAAAIVMAACGDDDRGGGDGGGAGDAGPVADAGPEMCTIPQTTCPEDQPYAGAACATTEPCTYPDPGGMYTWTYLCMGGGWAGMSDCVAAPGGTCPVGPLGEPCRPPFDGMLTGATVEIGPAGGGAFRPF